MSKTYDIVCHDCKVVLWCGEEIEKNDGSDSRIIIYKIYKCENNDFSILEAFLKTHERHRLQFMSDIYSPSFYEGYRKIDEEGDPLYLSDNEIKDLSDDSSLSHAFDNVGVE